MTRHDPENGEKPVEDHDRPGRVSVWVTRGVAVLVGVAVALAAVWYGSGGPKPVEVALAVGFGAALGVSWLWMRRMDPLLGAVTASLVVMMVWGVGAFVAGVALPECPGATTPGRCSTADAAVLGLVGAMTPGLMFAVLIPPVVMWRTGRGAARLRKRLRERVAAGGKPQTPTRANAPGHGTSSRTNGPARARRGTAAKTTPGSPRR